MQSSFSIYESKSYMLFFCLFILATCIIGMFIFYYIFYMFLYIFIQKLNIRCIPYDVILSIWIMNDRQREAVARKGFQSILEMSTDSLVVGSLLNWLMDKLYPVDMTIRPGPEKGAEDNKGECSPNSWFAQCWMGETVYGLVWRS
jgi:hypothetical protein